ncbi:hypothetical protein [Halalkalicoccus jeotgali]|uniref:Uncharacterized protein n=1 Tax=Halalkalicoccus jeotgali (strain DSM 18796 / CECT 7217 / JCM 14584 / KCTC 4019 / B3) TaxID=795797 RepID=D8J8E7_HALJB|nr:hypothetical protein [Halalkalicoccus jeotgali]ADJ16193.1 hypothetical protein HacjB3_14060 [Halalkalicoccus jeotgali B3]ELY37621.1 hypothetical protein C497_09278 [Halalkalicoccus jeotgali B3]
MLLFGPTPGGVEFTVILLTIFIFLAPVVLAIVAFKRYVGTDRERLSELEELRERVEE